MTITVPNPEAIVKRAVFLAWQACRGPMGMGVFQDRGEQNEEAVWQQAFGSKDYAMSHLTGNKPGRMHADYVFGRMMKLSLQWDDKSVTIRDDTPTSDYQSWCRKYPSYRELIEAAIESLKEPS